MELPIALKDLAEILQLRKELSDPYDLLLTSTISLNPQVLVAISGKSDWNGFSEWMGRKGLTDRKAVLKKHLSSPSDSEGYHALAKLLKAGYFSTVLTTNLDSFLENALFDSGLRPADYEMLVINRDNDAGIAQALNTSPRRLRIIKLRGSLSDGIIPDTFPESFDLRDTLRNSIARYINRDIVIVGSIERENDLRRALSSEGGRIYYVIPDQPATDDGVTQAMRARNIPQTAAVISGPYGHFETFFKTLEELLLPDTHHSAIDIPVKKEPQPSKLLISKPIAPLPPTKPQESVSPTTLSRQNQSLSQIPHEQRQSYEASVMPASRVIEEKQRGDTTSTVKKISTALIVIGVIALIFLLVSIFIRNTPSFTDTDTLFLLIFAAAIGLGIGGILTSEQITRIFTGGITSLSGNTTQSEDKKTGKTKQKEAEME